MKRKFACADFTFPLLSHKKVLRLIAMLEFDGADIGLFENRSHLWPSKVLASPTKSGRRLRRSLAENGLACADVFLQLDPSFIPYAINHPETSRRQRARDYFTRTLDFASACGARHVTALPGVQFKNDLSGASWARCCEELSWRVGQAKRNGITFSAEAHVGSIIPTPQAALRLLADVPGLTLTLDYTHFTKMGARDSDIEPLAAYASHFHARGACPGRLQTSLTQNTIDYPKILRALERAGYRGYVGVEYVWMEWERCNELDTLSETIRLRDLLRGGTSPDR